MRFSVVLCCPHLPGQLPSLGQEPAFREKHRALVPQPLPEAAVVIRQWEKAQPQDPETIANLLQIKYKVAA